MRAVGNSAATIWGRAERRKDKSRLKFRILATLDLAESGLTSALVGEKASGVDE